MLWFHWNTNKREHQCSIADWSCFQKRDLQLFKRQFKIILIGYSIEIVTETPQFPFNRCLIIRTFSSDYSIGAKVWQFSLLQLDCNTSDIDPLGSTYFCEGFEKLVKTFPVVRWPVTTVLIIKTLVFLTRFFGPLIRHVAICFAPFTIDFGFD